MKKVLVTDSNYPIHVPKKFNIWKYSNPQEFGIDEDLKGPYANEPMEKHGG